jgi:hypothetical protein
MRSLLCLGLAAFSLTACATQVAYAPAPTKAAFGYSEAPITDGRWRITFRADSHADTDRIEDLALLRAADLTLAQGKEWFLVTDRFNAAQDGDGVRSATHVGFGHREASGLGPSFGLDRNSGPMIARTLVIQLGQGPAPKAADVYRASAVRQSLSPRV